MNPFLNLDITLTAEVLAAYELRNLIEGRAAIVAELDTLAGADNWDNIPAEHETRFSGLLDRLEKVVEPVLETRQAAQRRGESRSRIHAGNAGGNTGQGETRNRSGIVGGTAPTPAALGGLPTGEDHDILDPESLAGYSLLRGLRCLVDGRPIDGLEGEVQQELETRRDKPASGLLIPWGLPAGNERRGLERRDATSSNWSAMVPSVISPNMIDILRNAMVLVGMGATVLDDMIGTFTIPKKTATSSHYWVAEAAAVTESTPTVGQVAFSPETVGTFVDITRRLLLQTSNAAEQLVRNDIIMAIAQGLDYAGVNGAGASNEPEGIIQNSSVPVVAIGTNGGALAWSHVVDMETEVADSNADVGGMGYIFTSAGRGMAKKVDSFSGAGRPIWSPDNTVNGYRAVVSNQVPSNLTKGTGTSLSAAIFGNFADAVFALWGGIDITVDPSTLATSGGVRLIGLADADFQLRRTESFSTIVDIDPTA